jgi:hypothetical protein
MRASCLLLVGSLGLWLAPSVWALDEGEGLQVVELPRLQGRVRLGMGSAPLDLAAPGATGIARLSGASVLGDYYFSGRQLTRDGESSGFRATTGVFLGSRLGLWGGQGPAMLASSLVSVERHSFSLASETSGGDGGDNSAVPYVGLGYSGSSLKGGWGFSADLGLMALNPGNTQRLAHALGDMQSAEELVRDLRLSPVAQVGVSYSF